MKHYTNAEVEVRNQAYAMVPQAVKPTPPKWLDKALRKDFRKMADILVAANLFTEFDAAPLAQYLMALREYVNAGTHASAAIAHGSSKSAGEWSTIQDRYAKQCRNCAQDLGLTLGARCKLIMPTAMGEAPDEDDAFEVMLHRRQMACAKNVEVS